MGILFPRFQQIHDAFGHIPPVERGVSFVLLGLEPLQSTGDGGLTLWAANVLLQLLQADAPEYWDLGSYSLGRFKEDLIQSFPAEEA
jgi:hypothetical protein